MHPPLPTPPDLSRRSRISLWFGIVVAAGAIAAFVVSLVASADRRTEPPGALDPVPSTPTLPVVSGADEPDTSEKPPGWVTYRSKLGGFRVIAPSGGIEEPIFRGTRVTFDTRDLVMWVDSFELDRTILGSDDQRILRRFGRQLVRRLERREGLEVVSIEPPPHDDLPGIRIRTQEPGGFMTVDVYVAARRGYQVGVSRSVLVTSADRQRSDFFLDSFHPSD
jgi:hypothetical protein